MYVALSDYWFQSSHIVAVKSASKDQSIVFCVGHSPVDGGFLIDEPIDDVMERLQMAAAMENAKIEIPEESDQDEQTRIALGILHNRNMPDPD